MKNVIVSYHNWRPELCRNIEAKSGGQWKLISREEELSLKFLQTYSPDFVFFVHWPYLIKSEIFEAYECVIFHMTDLPFGRGGSPLQNLIARGIYETKITALRCVEELDAGPVYLKRPLSLHGTAQEIYMRASEVIEEMIILILKERPVPQPQIGTVVKFKRRTPEEGDISQLQNLRQIYDFIRMLNADGYPPAFIEHGDFCYEFSRASLRNGYIIADVKIKLKREK